MQSECRTQRAPRRPELRSLCAAVAAFVASFGLVIEARAGVLTTAGDTLPYSGSVVSLTVQTAGIYDITAYGADGGRGGTNTGGGLGAALGGAFTLAAGQALNILVGQLGGGAQAVGTGGGGGGGGSYVVSAGQPLVIAGGGGGGATFIHSGGNGAGTGGSAAGGIGGGFEGGAGGGGFGAGNNGANGGIGAIGGGAYAGGTVVAPNASGFNAGGGIGGGGGGGYFGGGGGGGYAGGNGGAYTSGVATDPGAGGTSFLAPNVSDRLAVGALNTLNLGGNGEVVIAYEGPVSAPEPSSIALLATALATLALAAGAMRGYSIASGVRRRGGGWAASMVARSASVRRSVAAAALAWTWALVAAFGMAMIPGRRRHQASATCAGVAPWRLPTSASAFERSSAPAWPSGV